MDIDTRLAIATVSAALVKEMHAIHMRVSRYKKRIVVLEGQVAALEEAITHPDAGGAK